MKYLSTGSLLGYLAIFILRMYIVHKFDIYASKLQYIFHLKITFSGFKFSLGSKKVAVQLQNFSQIDFFFCFFKGNS